MALSRERKDAAVGEIAELLANSKMTIFANYGGTTVKQMQELRSQAKDSGTAIKVVKNRLFKKALASNESLKHLADTKITGQLLYGFNSSDEVAPAQNLAAFARENPQIEFVGAITQDGQLLNADDVKALAALPSKDQLRGQLIAMFNAPASGLVNTLAANVRGVLNVLNARAENLGN